MTTPVGEIHRPEAERFRNGRKIYLVPLFLAAPTPIPELQLKLDSYWAGANEHVGRLESALGLVDRIYHETVYESGDEGRKLVEQINPRGYQLVKPRCEAGAWLEATEDRALVEESFDWQGCMSIGLVSEKATSTVLQSYLEVTSRRYEYIASRIDSTLKKDESAILIIGEGHRVQFPGDIQVFYIAPPALDELKRWVSDASRRAPRPPGPQGAPGETSESGGDPQEGPPGEEL